MEVLKATTIGRTAGLSTRRTGPRAGCFVGGHKGGIGEHDGARAPHPKLESPDNPDARALYLECSLIQAALEDCASGTAVADMCHELLAVFSSK